MAEKVKAFARTVALTADDADIRIATPPTFDGTTVSAAGATAVWTAVGGADNEQYATLATCPEYVMYGGYRLLEGTFDGTEDSLNIGEWDYYDGKIYIHVDADPDGAGSSRVVAVNSGWHVIVENIFLVQSAGAIAINFTDGTTARLLANNTMANPIQLAGASLGVGAVDEYLSVVGTGGGATGYVTISGIIVPDTEISYLTYWDPAAI